jgi:hypothetical protein
MPPGPSLSPHQIVTGSVHNSRGDRWGALRGHGAIDLGRGAIALPLPPVVVFNVAFELLGHTTNALLFVAANER